VARELLPEKDANELIGKLHQIHYDHIDGRFDNVDVLLDRHEFSPAETDAIILQMGANHLYQGINFPGGLEKAIPEYKDWLVSRFPQETDRRVGEALGKWIVSWGNNEKAYEAILNFRSFGMNDEAVIAFLNTTGLQLGEEKIEKLADMLTDRELAAKIIDRIKSPATE
jgi:hypothetical protein